MNFTKGMYWRFFALLFSLTTVFLVGMGIGHYHLPPYEILRKHFRWLTILPFKDKFSRQPPEIQGIDYAQFLHVKSITDVHELRNRLVKFIWSNKGFPTQIEGTEAKPPVFEVPFLIRPEHEIVRLDVEMEFGFNSLVYYFRPRYPNGKLVILQQGHAAERAHDERVVDYFLSRGFDVAHIDMLLQNGNSRPIVETVGIGKVRYRKHDQLKYLESTTFNPLQLFFDPIAATINYATRKHKPKSIALVGLSGGGWITSVYAALDTRVLQSFPVAGTAPLAHRFALPATHWGDYEQTHPGLNSMASELDMYVMASVGEGRSQKQIFNVFDPCCFSGRAAMAYERSVQTVVKNIGLGRFDIWMDDSTFEHEISESALHKINQALTP